MEPVLNISSSTESQDRNEAIRFDRVSKSYGAFKAVDDVTISVADGEFVTILGPSGSGKSTLLSMAVGAVIPTEGTLRFHGRNVTDVAPHKRNIGMVFQRYTLFPNKTVAENVAFPLQLRKLPKSTVEMKVAAMLDLVGLNEYSHRYPSEISGGQAQRVAVARALVFDPDLMLMDEPLGALDKALRESLQEEIQRIQRQTRVPTLYVTHDQDEAMNLSDRIIVMQSGKIVANGAPKSLYENPPSLWVAKFLGEANAIPLASMQKLSDTEARVSVQGGASFVSRYEGTLPAKAVAILRPERCIIGAPKGDGSTSIPATVIAVTYLGARQRVRLRLDDGTGIVASIAGYQDISPGMSVQCTWEDRSTFLVEA